LLGSVLFGFGSNPISTKYRAVTDQHSAADTAGNYHHHPFIYDVAYNKMRFSHSPSECNCDWRYFYCAVFYNTDDVLSYFL